MKKAFVLILAICLFSPLSLLAATPKKGRVTSKVKHGLTIRKKPTSKSKKISPPYMWAGDTFKIKAVSGKWFKTTYKGVTGWVYSGKYVDVIETSDDEEDNTEKTKVPNLKKSAKKANVKLLKPTDKNYTGKIIDIEATSDFSDLETESVYYDDSSFDGNSNDANPTDTQDPN